MAFQLSLHRVFVVTIALGLFVMAARSATDPDLGWHLRTGQTIVQTHTVPRTDSYSFTRSGQRWIDHEWLSQVVMYAAYRISGWGGLICLFAAITAGAHFLVFLRSAGKPYIAGVLTIWGAWASAPSWGARPQMFSLFLASLFLLLLERSEQRRNLLWWTVPLTLFWVNLHGAYAVGIGLIGLFLVGALLDSAFGFESWNRASSRLRILAVAFLGCLAVVPLNPNGFRLFTYPLETVASASIEGYIVEWASPNFHLARHLPLLFLLLAILAGLALSRRGLRPRSLLLLLTTAGAALHSVRHIPIFALVAVPILSGLTSEWTEQAAGWPKAAAVKTPIGNGKSLLNAVLLLGFIGFVLARVAYVIHRQPQAETEKCPVAVANFLAKNRLPGPIFNAYDWGGYFIWRLYPEYRVFIDGRADLYGDALMREFASTYEAKKDWQAALERWHILTVVIPNTAPLAAALRLQPRWKPIYEDAQAVVLEKQSTNGSGGSLPSAH